jgi:hypothetical protein
MSQLQAVYLTANYYAADDLQQRMHRRAVGLLCELLLEEVEGPVADLGKRVQTLADEVTELERALKISLTVASTDGRRMYGKRKQSIRGWRQKMSLSG